MGKALSAWYSRNRGKFPSLVVSYNGKAREVTFHGCVEYSGDMKSLCDMCFSFLVLFFPYQVVRVTRQSRSFL